MQKMKQHVLSKCFHSSCLRQRLWNEGESESENENGKKTEIGNLSENMIPNSMIETHEILISISNSNSTSATTTLGCGSK